MLNLLLLLVVMVLKRDLTLKYMLKLLRLGWRYVDGGTWVISVVFDGSK